jgi:K+-sensing histidine kinase KdpD
LFASIARIQRRPLIAYSIAIALFIIELIGRFALTEVLPTGFPFLTFFPAILLSAYLGGIGPGIVCATISTVAALYWFIPPVGGFSLNLQSAVALVFFIVISIVDLLIIHVMQRSLHELRQERNLTRTLLTQQKTLFQGAAASGRQQPGFRLQPAVASIAQARRQPRSKSRHG